MLWNFMWNTDFIPVITL